MLDVFKNKIRLFVLNKKFRRLNAHNYTWLTNICDIEKIKVGNYTYGPLSVKTYGVANEMLKIGSFCSIASNVTFLLAGEHSYDRISTYPFKTKIFKQEDECFSKGNILIGDDVWIGHGATILSGVTIGQGAIIGANTVVAKDIPPYAIYANGKIIKYRFSENIINKLLKINYANLTENLISEKISSLYETIDEDNIDEVLEGLINDEK